MKDIVITEVLPNVFLAVITAGLVVGSLTLDDPEVLHGCLNCTGLFTAGTVGGSEDEGAVLLACPAQIHHWLHQPN